MLGAWLDIPGDTPGILLESYTPTGTFETFLIISFNHELHFCRNPCFTKLDISLDIYFSFASLVDFLGPEISF